MPVLETTRRDVLKLALSLLTLGPALFLGSSWLAPKELEARRVHRLLGELFRDAAAARAIGIAYLAGDHDAKRQSLQLAQSVMDLRIEHVDHLRSHLRARIAADFGAGRTAVVDQWILARTEAQVCALTVILSA